MQVNKNQEPESLLVALADEYIASLEAVDAAESALKVAKDASKIAGKALAEKASNCGAIQKLIVCGRGSTGVVVDSCWDTDDGFPQIGLIEIY